MKRALLTFMLFFLSFQIFATESKLPIAAPFSGVEETVPQDRFVGNPQLHPDWMHQVTAVNHKAGTITLEDGSKWLLNYWFSSDLKNWAVGDQVTVAWYNDTYFTDTRIKNYTNKSYAWCKLDTTPQADASGFRYIESMPNSMTIVLNNGTRIISKDMGMFVNFGVGDVVLTLYGNTSLDDGNKTAYALWNLNARLIAYNLKVDAQVSE